MRVRTDLRNETCARCHLKIGRHYRIPISLLSSLGSPKLGHRDGHQPFVRYESYAAEGIKPLGKEVLNLRKRKLLALAIHSPRDIAPCVMMMGGLVFDQEWSSAGSR